MTTLGVVANPNHWPGREELERLHAPLVRSIVYNNDDFERCLEDTPPGVKVVALLNNEHRDVKPDWSYWTPAVHEFASRFKGSSVIAVECGNELDQWGLSPSFGAKLVRDAALPLENANMAPLLSSVVGPDWQTWLEAAMKACSGWAHGACFHPYGQRPEGFSEDGWGFGNMRGSILRAYDLAQVPIWLTEYGCNVGDAGGEDEQALYLECAASTLNSMDPYVVPHAAWFAYTDAIGTPEERGQRAFGLVRLLGGHRPAYDAYIATNPLPVSGGPSAPILSPLTTAWSQLWRVVDPTLAYNDDIAAFAIPTYWRENFLALGSPVAPEIPAVDGVLQSFTRGIVRWTPDGGVERVV